MEQSKVAIRDTLDLFGVRLDATKTSIIGLIIKGTIMPTLPAFSLRSFSLFLGYIPQKIGTQKNWCFVEVSPCWKRVFSVFQGVAR